MQTGAVTLRCPPHRKSVLNADHSKIFLRCNAFTDGEHCRTAGARRNAYTPTPKENIPVRANSTSGVITVFISIINGARAQPTGTDVGRGTLLPTDGMRCIPNALFRQNYVVEVLFLKMHRAGNLPLGKVCSLGSHNRLGFDVIPAHDHRNHSARELCTGCSTPKT